MEKNLPGAFGDALNGLLCGMELQLAGKTFAVGGTTSGLGEAIARQLIAEGAIVIGTARGAERLTKLATELGAAFIPWPGDLTDPAVVTDLLAFLADRDIEGCVLNAGGPPTGTVADLDLEAWDEAWKSTLRWKIQLTRGLLPQLQARPHGRLLYIESVSIKQPIDNLVLSNVMRAGVAGFVKTLSREVGHSGLTVNVLAPGYHATPRITTVLEESAQQLGTSFDEVAASFTEATALGRLGQPADLAAMAALLLSPAGGYITGQTITIDGGLVRHITG